MSAELCPVCGGKGRLGKHSGVPTMDWDDKTSIVCHGCGGRGWVETQGYTPYVPYIPPYEPPVIPWRRPLYGPYWEPWCGPKPAPPPAYIMSGI